MVFGRVNPKISPGNSRVRGAPKCRSKPGLYCKACACAPSGGPAADSRLCGNLLQPRHVPVYKEFEWIRPLATGFEPVLPPESRCQPRSIHFPRSPSRTARYGNRWSIVPLAGIDVRIPPCGTYRTVRRDPKHLDVIADARHGSDISAVCTS